MKAHFKLYGDTDYRKSSIVLYNPFGFCRVRHCLFFLSPVLWQRNWVLTLVTLSLSGYSRACALLNLLPLLTLKTFQHVLLFISYKFVKGFLAITFLRIVISNWNFQRFLYNQEQNFSLIRQKNENFPRRISHFCNVMSIDMTLQKWAIFIMGVYGEISHILSDPAEISYLVT